MIRVLIGAALLLLVTDERTPVTGFFDLPVTGGTATYEMLGLRPEERGYAIALLARELFTQSSSSLERAAAVRNFVGQLVQPGKAQEIAGDTTPITIAAPLTADHWRDVMQLPDKADVFASLINNRAAMLVAAGAMSTDPSIRALLDRDRGLLRNIVKSSPAAFWVAARSLKLDKDRIVVPGGSQMEPVWESLVGEQVTKPADFVRALLLKDSARLAWFYDSVSIMNADRKAAIFADRQGDELRALYSAFRSADSNWKLEEHPFLRGSTDPWIVSSHIAVANGAVAAPNDQWFWNDLFDRDSITRRVATEARRDSSTKVSLSWLTQRITSSQAKERRDRYEMVRFAQAVFGNVTGDDVTETFIALGGYRRYRALLLTLDRIGVRAPRVYARTIEAARRIDDALSGRDERNAVIIFQASLAIVERARLTSAITQQTAERLILSLADLVDPVEGTKPQRPFNPMKDWLLTTLLDALPPLVQPDQWTTANTAYESRLLQALAGPPPEASLPTLEWEGLEYHVDLFAAEHERIKRIREQIESPGLDAALESNDATKIADALLSLIYAPALGDPEGPALLGGDIAQRHNFGLLGAAGMRRDLLAWAVPREQVGDGSPWHVEGSILGLDIALARLALRRIADNEMPVAPTINLNDQLTFARTVMTLNPRTMRDQDRDQIVATIARGRERLATAHTNLRSVTELADEIDLPAPVRQTLPWLIMRAPESVPALFSLRDTFWLGKPDLNGEALDAWGVYAESLHDRLRTTLAPPTSWENYTGRADGGLLATQTPDLILRMAEETARFKMPAQVVPSLLTFAAMDYWHDVESRFPDDWPAMARQALALSSSRVEDYVAALAGAGPLRPQ